MADIKKIWAENLKEARIKFGFTQHGLAELIGFSEKSISKWEAGGSIPGVETLIKLAEIFHTDINSLVKKHSTENFYLAIDGGGTKTSFVLADSHGNIIKKHTEGPSNPIDIGIKEAKEILRSGIEVVTKDISKSNVTMFAGISGGTTGDNQRLFSDFFSEFGFKKYKNDSDIKNSSALGLGFDDGIIMIMGTGISGFAVIDGFFKQIGGWGQLFDAGGSGYNLGRDGIYAVLREFDGTGEPTALTEMIEKRLGRSVKDSLGSIYDGGKKYIASFADLVISTAEAGDNVACRIIENNMLEAAKIINAGLNFIDGKNVKIAFTGGLITKNPQLFPLIAKHIKSKYTYSMEKITDEPVLGALKLAMRLDKTDIV